MRRAMIELPLPPVASFSPFAFGKRPGGYRFVWPGKYQHIALDPDELFRIWKLAVPGRLLQPRDAA